MSEVKRYGHISYLVEATPQMVQLYPSMTIYTLASDFDAQRLRADTAEAEVARLKVACQKEFEAFEEVSNKLAAAERRYEEMAIARDCIATNYNQLSYGASICKEKLSVAEHRIASHERMLRFFASLAAVHRVGTAAMDYVAALNPNPEAESHE